MILLSQKKRSGGYENYRLQLIRSLNLKREVQVEVILPPSFLRAASLRFLILNDGQDLHSIKVNAILNRLHLSGKITEGIVISVHAGNRIQEYGIASQTDYLKRGSKAKLYSNFIIEELIPFLEIPFKLNVDGSSNAIAGWSLGGLSAFDIAWNHSNIFKKVGVFSGSFWWRNHALNSGYSDYRHRITHNMVRKNLKRDGMQFWFQAGTKDELADRNNNGIIDSVDDTLDLIVELTRKGYRPFHDIQYIEVVNGSHNLKTWQNTMPLFLEWLWGKQKV